MAWEFQSPTPFIIGLPSMQIIPTLGSESEVYKKYLLWSVWSLRVRVYFFVSISNPTKSQHSTRRLQEHVSQGTPEKLWVQGLGFRVQGLGLRA